MDNAGRQFWVVGGEYADTNFKKLAKGKTEERKGPFEKYDDALAVWQDLAWKTVDDCLANYHIKEEDLTADLTVPTYWVVGGEFTDTSFKNFSSSPERYGPYTDYSDAEGKWQEMAWKTVDNATAMYRIETVQPKGGDAKGRSDDATKLAYRLLTGEDNAAFCSRVSDAIAEGYVLYGSPALTMYRGKRHVAQAVVLKPA